MADDDHKPKRMGRPRKYASDAKRPTLTFRVRDALYEKLKLSAEQGQRSISEEIERRVDLSFRDYDTLSMLAGGNNNADFLWSCMTMFRFIEDRYGVDWREDDEYCIIVAHAVAYIAARAGNIGLPGLKGAGLDLLAKANALSQIGKGLNREGENPLDKVEEFKESEAEGFRLIL